MSLTIAEINLSHLIHNLKQVKSLIPQNCKILSVVKANAYGHGMIRVSKELENAGVDMLGVAHVEEGICLRESGVHTDILIMGGVDDAYASAVIRWRLTPILYAPSFAEALSRSEERRVGKE